VLPSSARAWFGACLTCRWCGARRLTGELTGLRSSSSPIRRCARAWLRACRLAGGELMLDCPPPRVRGGFWHASAIGASAPVPSPHRKFQQPLHAHRRAVGEVLKATAQSVKHQRAPRLLLCTFDANGGLVANAPHMPCIWLDGRECPRCHHKRRQCPVIRGWSIARTMRYSPA